MKTLNCSLQVGALDVAKSKGIEDEAYPDIEPSGWQGLKEISTQIQLPLYALGEVSAEDEPLAINAGVQGVAGNRGYWKD